MERQTVTALALFLIFPLASMTAQEPPSLEEPPVVTETASSEEIFAPYPLRIRVGLRADGIILTWEDGVDKVEGYAIYRSEKPIDRETFPDASRLAVLPSGTHEYLDVPEKDAAYYYAVLGLTAEGSAYEVFIPLKNISIAAVSYASAREEGSPVPKIEEKRPPEPPPVVRAESRKDGIRISWSPVREGHRIVLYRSPAPIRSLSDLLTASWVASAAETQDGLMDYPVPGIGYYYALVDDEGLRTGNPSLVTGGNATTEPVSVPVGLYRVGLPEIPYASRSLPLPFLSLTKGVGNGSLNLPGDLSVPSPSRLSPETEKTLAKLGAFQTPRPSVPRDLTIFPEDLDTGSTGGEEYTLRLIVKQRLSNRDWKAAADELSRYLSLNRSPGAAARAHFYLGQALAFSGAYRDAFFEFLVAQDPYYAESNEWIDWLLDQLPRTRSGM